MGYVFLTNGCEEIEALCVVDLLRRANIEVYTVGVGGKTVVGSHGISINCDRTVEETDISDSFDFIVLPGGIPGANNLDENKYVDKFISYSHENGKLICAICAAPFILGKRNILKGKKATCYPSFEKYFNGGVYENRGVVVDGNIITGRSMGSAVDFSLEIIRKIKDDKTAEKIKNSIIY